MAFDGVTISCIVSELKKELVGGRLYKIAQPEGDELLLTIKQPSGTKRLFLSADASLPLIYLTESNKPSPMTAPNFCMLLRKHLQNGRIIEIRQPGLERIVHITVEHLDEMGDLRQKTLIMEIMGKHSNIIFCDEDNKIIDSIKHVSAAVSSVREVLPGKPYFMVQTQDKTDILSVSYAAFRDTLSQKPQPLFKALYGSFVGISPILAQELCYRACLDGELPTAAFGESDYHMLYEETRKMTELIEREEFAPHIAYSGTQPVEFAAFPLHMYESGADRLVPYVSVSELLEHFYAEKNTLSRIRQKSSDLRRIVQTALERNVKKYDLQLRQMQDTEKRETYRIYGELLNTYGYEARPGDKSLEALNYYTDETITIPLDPTLSATENAKKYFDKYGKLKRTYEALSVLTKEVKSEIEHLESIMTSLDIALWEEDLVQIKEELTESGYIRKRGGGKKAKVTSRPFHYISSDGFHMYVGKNNYQNDELTFQFASGNDWWFHAKKLPGSHVIVKMNGAQELPDSTFEEAGRLAAYYSKGRNQEKVEIDYVQKKQVKKPNGAKPGFVVYYTNFSMVIDSNIDGIKQAEE
ncbi:MAG: NFACT family protein [Bacteroidales bacterium]|nr:NFACT family protein [Lachnoclostridium sp.]MCM1383334.1 NFACT family protein [Lachnoclostridium sp.]MCM1464998.1 NFACT family protein [Bacteroidales bacterium]